MIRTHNFEPNVKFDFDVSVSNCMLSTDTSKLNLTLGTFKGICPGGLGSTHSMWWLIRIEWVEGMQPWVSWIKLFVNPALCFKVIRAGNFRAVGCNSFSWPRGHEFNTFNFDLRLFCKRACHSKMVSALSTKIEDKNNLCCAYIVLGQIIETLNWNETRRDWFGLNQITTDRWTFVIFLSSQ